MKVVFCVPTLTKPHKACTDSLAASEPLLKAAGWEHGLVFEIGCPYISSARATMLRKALDAKADVIVFIDHDLSWRPQDLLTLIETEGDVVAGVYRFKKDEEEYMGSVLTDDEGNPIVRLKDGALHGFSAPAGFLKITTKAVNDIIRSYPELVYGELHTPHVDLFNHGAYNHTWYGEDYAFCRRWLQRGGELFIVPDLNLDHHTETAVYKGNFHLYLRRQPGGDLCTSI
jgi:hypothetical protein